MYYRVPDFLAVVWFGSFPFPSPLSRQYFLSFSVSLCVAQRVFNDLSLSRRCMSWLPAPLPSVSSTGDTQGDCERETSQTSCCREREGGGDGEAKPWRRESLVLYKSVKRGGGYRVGTKCKGEKEYAGTKRTNIETIPQSVNKNLRLHSPQL